MHLPRHDGMRTSHSQQGSLPGMAQQAWQTWGPAGHCPVHPFWVCMTQYSSRLFGSSASTSFRRRMRPHALGCLQEWPDNPELAAWVRRQRALHSQGQLSAERHQILSALGFEFGEGAHITQEWESNFDQLVDWLLWQVRAHSF